MESYWFFDQLLDVLVSGEQTGGAYSILELWGPQGFATPLHVHRDVDEGFYVIEGELTIWAGDDVTVLNAGDFVLAPRGVPHTIKNTAAGDTHMLVTSTPAGFEDFVRAYGTLAPTHELPVLDGPPRHRTARGAGCRKRHRPARPSRDAAHRADGRGA